MDGQMTVFDQLYPLYKIGKPIRLIELFAGVGSQAMALRDIGADFESHCICEWQVHAAAVYRAIHRPHDMADHSGDMDKMDLADWLHKKGISPDGKVKYKRKTLMRKPEKWLRKVYSDIVATNNIGDITAAKGADMGITDKEKWCYVMTYSFPCQDLSIAGKRRGMSRGTATRSGLLWEVERLLSETPELPDILLMENVPGVMGADNVADFGEWQDFLGAKGYTNYMKIINATDHGIAQNRERCFMVSLLGKYNYKFPQGYPLDNTVAAYVEDEVEESYYIDTEAAKRLIVDFEDRIISKTIRGGGQGKH